MNTLHKIGRVPFALLFAVLFAVPAAPPAAYAHIASNGFLNLKVDGGQAAGAVEIAIRDGELAVGLDHDGNGKVTWGELKGSQTALQNYMLGHLRLSAEGGQCRME